MSNFDVHAGWIYVQFGQTPYLPIGHISNLVICASWTQKIVHPLSRPHFRAFFFKNPRGAKMAKEYPLGRLRPIFEPCATKGVQIAKIHFGELGKIL